MELFWNGEAVVKIMLKYENIVIPKTVFALIKLIIGCYVIIKGFIFRINVE